MGFRLSNSFQTMNTVLCRRFMLPQRSILTKTDSCSTRLSQFRLQSTADTGVEVHTKPRKTYRVMRKVNPTEDILSPEQWKHMRHQTMIQNTRWNLQGGWKKKLLTFSIVASLTGYIYYYTIIKMSRDSFYAELEHAEHMERLRKGSTPVGYDINTVDEETD